MRKSNAYWPAGILAAGCVLLWQAHSQSAVPLAGSLASILSGQSGYDVIDQKLSDEERRVAGMTSYVARAYTKGGVPEFTTLVSYYDRQTQGSTIHSPRNCLPGAGWEVVNAGTVSITRQGATETVNRYELRNGASTALAYYWYQGRGRVTANEYRVKWNLLRDAALRGHTEEALVRIVVPIRTPTERSGNDDDHLARADAVAQGVAKDLMSDVDRVLPRSPSRS